MCPHCVFYFFLGLILSIFHPIFRFFLTIINMRFKGLFMRFVAFSKRVIYTYEKAEK